jgi:hypothetical protein
LYETAARVVYRTGRVLPRRSSPVLLVGLLLALAAGCSAGTTGSSHSNAARPATLRVSCSDSWIPTAQTFKGFGAWRSTSIRIGPITLMGARAAAQRDVAAYGSIKFRTLVHPKTKLTIAIAPQARSVVGFVAPADALRSYFPDRGAAVMELAPCPGVPPDQQAIPGLADVGYPIFLRVRRNACVGLTVRRARGGQTFRGTVSIGAGRCRSS